MPSIFLMLYVHCWTYSSWQCVVALIFPSHKIMMIDSEMTHLARKESTESQPPMPAGAWQVMSVNEAGGRHAVWSPGIREYMLCLKGQALP